ncbi:MAG: hypothetical protein C5B51_02195 [Terriglobia bacterium]|nr:MAG: hypothetical protein C5B51_02195 [Terriglobia bacterium]
MPLENHQDRAVLVLNPGEKDAKLIASLLEKVGLDVMHASNTNDALDLFSGPAQSARLLVIDEAVSPASMPAFLNCVRSLDPGIRILLVSGREDFDPSEPWVESTTHSFLMKPFRRAKFLASVLQLTGEPLVRTA